MFEEATIALTIMSLGIFIIFIGFLVWGIRSGQFRNVEEPKYKMLENEVDEEIKEDKNA
jgi:nitrogen fixation-related uncharacterized protein